MLTVGSFRGLAGVAAAFGVTGGGAAGTLGGGGAMVVGTTRGAGAMVVVGGAFSSPPHP